MKYYFFIPAVNLCFLLLLFSKQHSNFSVTSPAPLCMVLEGLSVKVPVPAPCSGVVWVAQGLETIRVESLWSWNDDKTVSSAIQIHRVPRFLFFARLDCSTSPVESARKWRSFHFSIWWISFCCLQPKNQPTCSHLAAEEKETKA